MAVEVGKRYYLLVHAYHHLIAEIVAITGKREADVRRVIRVQSCTRGWTDFFRDGLNPRGGSKSDTVYTHFPDGNIQWFAAFEWNHDIPELPNAPR
jgi:hypothetical protein